MLAIGEDFGLMRQVRPAAIDEVDAWQTVLLRNLLRAQVLLHRHGIIGAALHRGIVAHDHHLTARHAANPADQTSAADRILAIHAVRGKLADLQKRRAGVQQPFHPLAGKQFAARHMALAAAFRTAQRSFGNSAAQFIVQPAIVLRTRLCFRRLRIEFRCQDRSGHLVVSSVLVSVLAGAIR